MIQRALFTFFFVLSCGAFAQVQGDLQESRDEAFRQAGYTPWVWGQSDCAHCSIYLVPVNEGLDSEPVMRFLTTLAVEKKQLMKIYGIHGQEYNLLAHMAVGILGRESQFFTSTRYLTKEAYPGLIRMAKILKAYAKGIEGGPSRSSRGPTQIKIVPERIAEAYGIKAEDLHIPERAAIATMGFLIEILEELKRRVVINDLQFVSSDNYVDYLPYLYFGSRKMLLNGNATPEKNIYVQDMKRYMSWVAVYEGPTDEEVSF